MKYLATATTILLCLPVLVFAADYQPLIQLPIPGGTYDPANSGFSDYINALYAMSISIAALLAVIKIVIAGVKWMLTDVVTSKGQAKSDIYNALLGLLVVLGAVLILTVINKDILNVNLEIDAVTTNQFQPANPVDPFTKLPGDELIKMQGVMTQPVAKAKCESVTPASCNFASPSSCYKGEYYFVDNENKCLVRAANYVEDGNEFDCVDTEPNSIENNSFCSQDSSCLPSVWDCTEATKKCVDAGLKFINNTDEVECVWP